ncbi:hypothetical protein [Streptomyces longispororuber]|uniref:hypothetical protein n=1 Tax=Streptomyces longispororuber TaxID=68230 RepID=UPI0036FF0622
MATLDERSWAEAMELFAHRFSIVKVARREHEDWTLDVPVLMHGDTPDPRGWFAEDSLEGEFERLEDPYYPFVVPPEDPAALGDWKSHLHEIPRASALRLLVALSTDWINVEKVQDFAERRAGLEEKAAVILSRFPEGSRFYANTGRDSENRDYYQRISGCSPISRYAWDVGMFLVSDTEIGMAWAFINW